jgi:WS/DGAT/MGAT family acyltransferase
VDQAFFLLETPERPMNAGALLLLRPPQGSQGARFVDRLLAGMLECPVGPPFNYRLKPGLVRPLLTLEEDEHADARSRVHRHSLPRRSNLETLFAHICRIHVKLLPRDELLWQMHVFTGLPDGRVALYFKTHHGIIDGIGFIRIFTGILSSAGSHKRARAIWEGMLAVPPPEGQEKHQAAATRTLLDLASDARLVANDLARLTWHLGLRGLGIGSGLAAPFVNTPNVLKAPPSANRVLAHCKLSLASAQRVAKRGGAKVNDVMLATIDMAMNRYLEERGSPPDAPLVADVPVALHDHGGAGNRITILQVPMGVPGSKPRERLRRIVQETQQMKREVRALSGGSLMVYSILEHSLASTIESLHLGELPMLANVVISNPAGFKERVRFNGAEVELALPISVVGAHQVLNVTVTTYAEDLHVTFIALKEAVPDLGRMAGYTVEALAQLERDVARGRKNKIKAP